MHPDNPFAPAPPVREPLTTGEAVPIAAMSALPVVASIINGGSLAALGGAVASALVFFAGIIVVLRHGRPGIATSLTGGMMVGAVTGISWWSLVDSGRSLEECVTVGALGGVLLLATELYRAFRREH